MNSPTTKTTTTKKKTLKINEDRFYNIEVVVLSMKTHSVSFFFFFFPLMKSPCRDKESEKKNATGFS